MTSGFVKEGARWQTRGQRKEKRMSRSAPSPCQKKQDEEEEKENLSCRVVLTGLASKVELSPQRNQS